MDFMKLLRSLEDFLYEVMTWLVFYPRTLWRVIRHPMTLMAYSDAEQAKGEDDQYLETLNPLLFLMLTLLMVHGAELSVRSQLMPVQLGVLTPLLKSDVNLLLLRGVVFSVFPLLFAVTLLHRLRLPLDRKSLKGPFLAQCFTATLFAGLLSLSTLILQVGAGPMRLIGLGLVPTALAWYLTVQSAWLSRFLKIGRLTALMMAMGLIILGALSVIAVALLMSLA